MEETQPLQQEEVVQDEKTQSSPVSGTEAAPPQAEKIQILCVDDEENILKALVRLFRTEPLKVLTATSGKAGLEILQQNPGIGLVISDQRMPEMTGTEFLQKAAQLAPDTPRMILTGYADMSAAIAAINQGGAQRFLVKPWNEQELILAVRDGLQRYQLVQENHRLKTELEEWNASLKQRVLQQTALLRKKLEESRQLTEQPQKNSDAIITMFGDMLDQRNQKLGRHCRNVAALTDSITKSLNLPQSKRDIIRNAALLHDVGMLSVSDRVLAKSPEMMTNDELAEYRSHAIKGQRCLKVSDELEEIGRIIRHHHEEFEGNGFPDGLAGEQIPLGSRIIHLASFIDKAYSPEAGMDAKYQVTRKLAPVMGVLFDPALTVAANLAVKEVLDNPRAQQKGIVEQEIPLKDLKIGMILTRDIYSSRGIIVIERGEVTAASMESIKRHEANIPLNRAAYIQKTS
jgi:putative nucleotidyltransferase with HDIG domain